MESRKECWYSVVRYSANELAGEVINVGVLLHTIGDKVNTKFLLLEEHSPKIKAISKSQVDLNIYKSFKDSLEYYLSKSVDNILGEVGEVVIGTPLVDDFLEKLFDHYKDKKLSLTRPTFSLSSDPDTLFSRLFETYIGEKYLLSDHKQVSVKKYLKELFEERKLLNKKVAHDFTLTPIKDLDNIKINIDFGYKNGVWNYMQTIPNLSGPAKNTEWFAKTKFMFDNLDKDAKVHLMYRSSDFTDEKEFFNVINYFSGLDSTRIFKFDLDDKFKVSELCNVIERDAHDIDELLIS
ncbi:DUF3037 domain-containing protein [Heyndrickxia sporothermodurans]|uniref:DUF3037 domain-containing protein n=1 Tax=Heyndrickxia sporothermodurans TaxID=46224 RepID=A0A150LGI5_9BACI|nr:DUF3037 domain-containing protein [Heyndrickxia sporothermodurans]KYD11056.1 hypothetical protein B4102_0116 [Heyndrickxia sporothermodurans]MED3649601.1 DUF3037 domain-containing protein [Heyndrickxia sporothermodurans]MED3699903.1 DUF3037 domain-containing protein [Heyndrickxia sporothermodurans]